MEMVIGRDLGTTHCKAVAVRADGTVHATAAREVTMLTPHEGWAAQRADDVADAAEAVLDETAQGAAAIILSGAMHSVLPIGDDDTPLADAMTWADTRCAAQWCAVDAEARGLYDVTGCPSHTTYHPARLHWFNEHCRGAMYVGLRDYVAHHLTGAWACDTVMASATGLLDVRRGTWCDAALALAGVTPDQLPPLVEPDTVIGAWRGIPVMIGSSDGALANLGAGAATPGSMAMTIGTSGAVRYVSGEPVLDAQQRTWCYRFPGKRYLAGGAINNAGLLMKWLRQTCYADVTADDPYAVMLAEAGKVEPGAGGVTVLPYLSGERSPHFRADLTASVHGLTLAHGRAHIARAAAEAVAYCLRSVREALPPGSSHEPLRITGGVTRYSPWLAIVADVLGEPLAVVDAADASALGAALLGCHALGWVADLTAWQQTDLRVIEPNADARGACDAGCARFRRLTAALHGRDA